MNPGPIVYGPKGEQVADLRDETLPEDERRANRGLILAAPDLLEACQEQHQAIDWLMAKVIGLDPTFLPSKSVVWEAMLKGNAAIAKASGQEGGGK